MKEDLQRLRGRDEFQARLSTFSEADRTLIMRAYDISEKAHRGQFRLLNEEPYFTHPPAAANILLDECGIRDAALICGALLHDVAEDTDHYVPANMKRADRKIPTTLGYREYIASVWKTMVEDEGFSERTAEIVISLTKPQIIPESVGVLVVGKGSFIIKTEKVLG